MALAYEVIFGVPVSELFAGLRHDVEKATLARVSNLYESLDVARFDPLIARKVEHLGHLIDDPVPPHSIFT